MDILQKCITQVASAKRAFCRYITSNDTGATGAHQSGFYIPKCASCILFDTPVKRGENKDRNVQIKWQDDFTTDSRFIYYGKGTRNEYRITRFGKDFPFLQNEVIGSLLILSENNDGEYHGYVLEHDEDIDGFLLYFGLSPENTNQLIDIKATPSPEDKLDRILWETAHTYDTFPSTSEMGKLARYIYSKVFEKASFSIQNSDYILTKWIDTEYRLLKILENKIYLPLFSQKFTDVQSYLDLTQEMTNRRKSRARKSLEHHLAEIFTRARIKFEEQVKTEDNKRPDFIFPSGKAYHDFLFPAEDLFFLGAKTTCKDRWRQILNEADRIHIKHLFTLQQGISDNQLKEMKHEGVRLVVPASYKNFFSRQYQDDIQSLSQFIEEVRHSQSRNISGNYSADALRERKNV